MITTIKVQAKDDQITIAIPQYDFHQTFYGSVIIDNLSQYVVDLSLSPEQLKERDLKAGAELTAEAYEGMKPYFKNFPSTNWQDIKQIYEADLKNGTHEAWEHMKDNFKFIYPFNIDALSTQYILVFLNYYTAKAVNENSRKGFWNMVKRSLWDSYRYDVEIEGYGYVPAETRSAHEKLFIYFLGKSYSQIKEFSLNGKVIF